MRLMEVKETLLLHKDYVYNIIHGELPFDEAIFLLSKFQGKGFSRFFSDNTRESLRQKGYLTIEGNLSDLGRKYVSYIIESAAINPEDVKIEQDFERFWKTFPSTDKLFHYQSSRSLKDSKKQCKVQFEHIIADGYTVEEIIKGLENQLAAIKIDTARTGENKLKFLKNSLRWLRDRDFINWTDHTEDNQPNFDLDVF